MSSEGQRLHRLATQPFSLAAQKAALTEPAAAAAPADDNDDDGAVVVLWSLKAGQQSKYFGSVKKVEVEKRLSFCLVHTATSAVCTSEVFSFVVRPNAAFENAFRDSSSRTENNDQRCFFLANSGHRLVSSRLGGVVEMQRRKNDNT